MNVFLAEFQIDKSYVEKTNVHKRNLCAPRKPSGDSVMVNAEIFLFCRAICVLLRISQCDIHSQNMTEA